jgi:Sulfotransferase domain
MDAACDVLEGTRDFKKLDYRAHPYVVVRAFTDDKKMKILRALLPATPGQKVSDEEAKWRNDGYYRIDESEESDIFICGYPRSGNTWFQNLLTGTIFGLDVSLTPDLLIQDLIPDVHLKHFYKRYGAVTYFKSHHLPQKQYRRVVHLVRDGRDAMVSYRDFLRNDGHMVDFEQLIRDEVIWPSTWQEHTRQWLENPFNAEILMIKYEDLQENPCRELQRFCEFANLERSEALIGEMIANASFQSMRGKELTNRRAAPEITSWPEDKTFVRRGVVGSHRDEMPPEMLEIFKLRAAAVLAQLGYI